MNAFELWLNFAWRPDLDGQPWHITDHDSGKGTAWGVTEQTWRTAVAFGLVHGNLEDAPKNILGMILQSLFWKKARCGEMHPAVGGVLFNIAMVDGPTRAAKILQNALGVTGDGIIGPETLAAVAAMDPARLVASLTAGEEAFTDALADSQWFGRGWRNRAEAARAYAMTFLPAAPAIA